MNLYYSRYGDIDEGIDRVPEIDTYKYGQLISDKVIKESQWRKDGLFDVWCRNSWVTICKTMNLNLNIRTYTQINWKWIIALNVESHVFLEETIGEYLYDLEYFKVFVDRMLKA